MWQRKQTVYLVLAAIAMLVALCLPVATFDSKTMGPVPVLYNMALVMPDRRLDFFTCPLGLVLAIAVAVTIITIFLFKKRMVQVRLCSLACCFVAVWYILLVAYAMTSLKAYGALQVTWSDSLPLVAFILCLMASRGIRADEKLVRSMDRIR
jgi:hypothetical protein